MAFFYAFLGMLCYGLAPLFGQLGVYKVNPVTAFSLRTIIAATLVMGWLIASKGFGQFLHIPPIFWLIIGAEAVLNAVLGDLAYLTALKEGNINDVTLVLTCAPLVTMLSSYLFWSEVITTLQLLGALFITVGLILIYFNS